MRLPRLVLTPRDAAISAALAAVYFIWSACALAEGRAQGLALPVLPPTGVGLAALLVFGIRFWPALGLASFAASVWVGRPIGLAALVAAAVMAEAVAAVTLLERAGFHRRLDRLRDVAALTLLAGTLAGLISATAGALSHLAGGLVAAGESRPLWHAWWLGNLASDVAVAPVLLTWHCDPRLAAPPRRWAEAAAAGLALAAPAILLFTAVDRDLAVYLGAYAVFPPLIWCALRFGPRGAASAAAVAAAAASLGTLAGHGPFARPALLDSLIAVKTFVAVMSVTTMTLAAAVQERDDAWKRIGTLNRELEAFNYSIAHDLRGPLRRIDALGETLGRHPERSATLTARIHEAVQRMAALIDSLLRLSGLEYAELSEKVVDLSALAKQAAEALAASDPGRRARFSIAEGLQAHGDPELLGVLLWNLLENAWKFTGRREVAEIEVGARDGQEGQVFYVRDNGAGFDPALAGTLFKPFRRLHGRSEFPGSGIGLAMAQRVVERHGGRIWAEAAVDRGATLSFTLSRQRINHERKAYLVGGRRSG